MANAVLDLTPPSMENIPPVLVHVGVAQEQPENEGQAVVDPIPLNEDFNPQVSSTPERDQKENTSSAEKRCKKLQNEKCKLKKQLLNLKKQLAEMRRQNDKLRKSGKRLMARQRVGLSEKFKPRGCKKLSAERKQAVINFLSRDENSRLLAGKKDTITKNKQKLQRRVLAKPLKELHAQYQTEVEQHLSMSYRQFARRRPFYITEPKSRDRDTCACVEHENVRLLVNKLAKRGLLKTTSISELVSMIVCDPKNKACMDCVCLMCCFNEVEFPETECAEISWEQWEREKSTNGEKTFANVLKQTYTGTIQDLKELFHKKLEALAIHQFNWIHQTQQFRDLKQNLTESEAVLHVDFSENYACKMNTEIQAYHFGGSRKQTTLSSTQSMAPNHMQHCQTASATMSGQYGHTWSPY
ncbi:uncharacterized protein LOC115356800 [Myripristis murdjan]|uniref:uncharacterized protein LOC115356800 n=1 Tax=Myripristis murdjan TaxID=586833 RepID=UPI0011760BED|nr:uncharacterized protein LOC115356800 [Myripristis murdjan]